MDATCTARWSGRVFGPIFWMHTSVLMSKDSPRHRQIYGGRPQHLFEFLRAQFASAQATSAFSSHTSALVLRLPVETGHVDATLACGNSLDV